METKLQKKQLREKEEEERQRRIAAKLKEKVSVVQGMNHYHQTNSVDAYLLLIQVDAHISRDPSRLTRPTKGWDERMKHVGPSGGGPMLQMFHRSDCP